MICRQLEDSAGVAIYGSLFFLCLQFSFKHPLPSQNIYAWLLTEIPLLNITPDISSGFIFIQYIIFTYIARTNFTTDENPTNLLDY